uniref:Osteoclast-stimulating factor 1 n=1 Tax=Macrostomum lignano TaxID=282301 RepID=A0A1I8I317_9PLAT
FLILQEAGSAAPASLPDPLLKLTFQRRILRPKSASLFVGTLSTGRLATEPSALISQLDFQRLDGARRRRRLLHLLDQRDTTKFMKPPKRSLNALQQFLILQEAGSAAPASLPDPLLKLTFQRRILRPKSASLFVGTLSTGRLATEPALMALGAGGASSISLTSGDTTVASSSSPDCSSSMSTKLSSSSTICWRGRRGSSKSAAVLGVAMGLVFSSRKNENQQTRTRSKRELTLVARGTLRRAPRNTDTPAARGAPASVPVSGRPKGLRAAIVAFASARLSAATSQSADARRTESWPAGPDRATRLRHLMSPPPALKIKGRRRCAILSRRFHRLQFLPFEFGVFSVAVNNYLSAAVQHHQSRIQFEHSQQTLGSRISNAAALQVDRFDPQVVFKCVGQHLSALVAVHAVEIRSSVAKAVAPGLVVPTGGLRLRSAKCSTPTSPILADSKDRLFSVEFAAMPRPRAAASRSRSRMPSSSRQPRACVPDRQSRRLKQNCRLLSRCSLLLLLLLMVILTTKSNEFKAAIESQSRQNWRPIGVANSVGVDKDELSFDAGDILYLVDSTNKDWYTARCGSSVGLIPSNYVEEQTEAVPQPMHSACQYGNLTFLAELIDNKVSVNGLDAAGNTALHWASRGGHAECVRLLLMANCDANAQNKSGDTALHLAAWKSHSAVVELLLFGDGAQVHTGVANASMSVKNRQGETPLAMAKDAEVKAALLRAARLLGRTTSATEADGWLLSMLMLLKAQLVLRRRLRGSTLEDAGRLANVRRTAAASVGPVAQPVQPVALGRAAVQQPDAPGQPGLHVVQPSRHVRVRVQRLLDAPSAVRERRTGSAEVLHRGHGGDTSGEAGSQGGQVVRGLLLVGLQAGVVHLQSYFAVHIDNLLCLGARIALQNPAEDPTIESVEALAHPVVAASAADSLDAGIQMVDGVRHHLVEDAGQRTLAQPDVETIDQRLDDHSDDDAGEHDDEQSCGQKAFAHQRIAVSLQQVLILDKGGQCKCDGTSEAAERDDELLSEADGRLPAEPVQSGAGHESDDESSSEAERQRPQSEAPVPDVSLLHQLDAQVDKDDGLANAGNHFCEVLNCNQRLSRHIVKRVGGLHDAAADDGDEAGPANHVRDHVAQVNRVMKQQMMPQSTPISRPPRLMVKKLTMPNKISEPLAVSRGMKAFMRPCSTPTSWKMASTATGSTAYDVRAEQQAGLERHSQGAHRPGGTQAVQSEADDEKCENCANHGEVQNRAEVLAEVSIKTQPTTRDPGQAAVQEAVKHAQQRHRNAVDKSNATHLYIYNAETWTLTDSLEAQVDVAHAGLLRAAFKIGNERVTNMALYHRAGLPVLAICCAVGDSSWQATSSAPRPTVRSRCRRCCYLRCRHPTGGDKRGHGATSTVCWLTPAPRTLPAVRPLFAPKLRSVPSDVAFYDPAAYSVVLAGFSRNSLAASTLAGLSGFGSDSIVMTDMTMDST